MPLNKQEVVMKKQKTHENADEKNKSGKVLPRLEYVWDSALVRVWEYL